MVRLLLVCIIIASSIGGAYWLTKHSGALSFTFVDYKVETTVTEFVVWFFVGLILLQVVLFWIYKLFLIPSQIKHYIKDKKRDKYIENLSGFIVAYVANDSKNLELKYKDLNKSIATQADLAMAYLIERVKENETGIKNKLVLLTKEPETKISAFEELIRIAVREKEWFIAANYCSELWKVIKNQGLAQQYVKCLINSKRWRELEEMLDSGSLLTSLFTKDMDYYLGKDNAKVIKGICRYKIAEELLEFGDRNNAQKYAIQALKTLDGFVPATYIAIKTILTTADTNEVIKLIKKQWKIVPHHLLSQVIFDFSKKVLDEKLYKIIKGIAALNPDNYESHLILARAALDSDQFEIASSHISEALSGARKLRACLMMAEFCQRTHANKAEIIDWIRQALVASSDKEKVNYYWDLEKSSWINSLNSHSVYIASI